jgi:SulP family sulfate permease
LQDTSSAPNGANRSIRSYLGQDLRSDVVAGLTVSVMGVPQAMAYAMIAGLAPVYGLYTSIVTCAVAAILGSSRHLVTGPTNGICIVMFGVVAHIMNRYSDQGLNGFEIIMLLSFLAGVIQLGFGLLRMGGLVRYVANSVVIGFTAGAGILIALNQVQQLLGVEVDKTLNATRSYQVLVETAKLVGDTNLHALAIGVVTALFVIFIPKIDRRLPGALIGVVVTAVGGHLRGWFDPAMGAGKVSIVGDTPPGVSGTIPGFRIPDLIASPNLELTRDLLGGALAVAILGLIEATSISRTIARSSRQRLDFNQEFIGQGASKIVGSFFSCFAGSGSFTRTALCYRSGGRTRMAALFSAFWTLLALLAFGGVANNIPTAALAGLLIVTAYTMVDKQRIMMSWHSGRNSQIVLVGTIASTLVLPLEFAIYVGVFLSLAVILRTTGKTDLAELVQRDDSGFDEVPFNMSAPSPIVTVNMEGDIYFAAAEDLDTELLRCLRPQTRVVVLRMRGLRAVGSTAMAMLEHYWTLLRERKIHLVVSGIQKELEDVMTSTGVRSKIGESNIFFADNKHFQATELALARAKSIVAFGSQRVGPVRGVTAGSDLPVAGDLMSKQCIRFGNKHQLREAVWLISELHQHTKSLSSEPLFLQDREGKLFGELSPWQILGELAAGAEGHDVKDLSDEQVAALLRRDFVKPIRLIARTDVALGSPDSSLVHVLEASIQNDQQVVPICDGEGRMKGMLSSDDIVRGLVQSVPATKPSKSGGGDDG